MKLSILQNIARESCTYGIIMPALQSSRSSLLNCNLSRMDARPALYGT